MNYITCAYIDKFSLINHYNDDGLNFLVIGKDSNCQNSIFELCRDRNECFKLICKYQLHFNKTNITAKFLSFFIRI